ncbi:MAG: type II secretion system protein GspM [Chromatiales bacterium]|jgi:MSHA biogenesis protein MshJ
MQWLEWFETRSSRERGLMLAGICGMLLITAYLLWFGPALNERHLWLDKLHQAEQEISRMQQQLARLEMLLQKDDSLQEEQRLHRLQQLSQQLDLKLAQAGAAMISPERVPEVLRDMLQDIPLMLLSLRKLPPEIEIEGGVEGVSPIYRHALQLELEGSYDDTLKYIERLERLPWGLAWETLDIHMQHYPKAHILLHLYTLSLQEEWLGV